MEQKNSKLPALKDIKWNDLESYNLTDKENFELRNFLLNQDPPEKWIKKHPTGGFKYLPISKVEYLLTRLFKDWFVEVLEVNQMLNAAFCRVRLYYWNERKKAFDHQDGVGAASFQLEAKSEAYDLSKIKQNSVEIAVPKAKIAATKDAADNIGKLFGRDISRKDSMSYTPDESRFDKTFED